jgi:hypothetical protein
MAFSSRTSSKLPGGLHSVLYRELLRTSKRLAKLAKRCPEFHQVHTHA